jgi:2-polyprenyl-6-methoxyphenol hydroxylase-like FAD-dependent oxidoreductase
VIGQLVPIARSRPRRQRRRRRRSPYGYNVRRQTLDPMLRDLAAETPGVELRRGLSAADLLRDGDRVTGVVARERDRTTHALRARLVVGADGRASRVAELAGLEPKQRPHGRIAYMAHYRGVQRLPDERSQMWMLDPRRRRHDPRRDAVVFDGSGHWPMLDDPEGVAAVVIPFLRRRLE